MKKMALAVIGLSLSLAAHADAYKPPTSEELDAHFALNSSSLACEALGQASMMVSDFAFQMGLEGPENAETVATTMRGFMRKSPPRAGDLGEAAYIAALDYVIDTPELIQVALRASKDQDSSTMARLKAYQATSAPCVVSQNLPYEGGFYETYKLRQSVVDHYRANRPG